MKKITYLIILFLYCNLYSFGVIMDFNDIRGGSVSYLYKKMNIAKSGLNNNSINVHTLAISLAGGIRGESNYTSSRALGNIGVVIGFTKQTDSPINSSKNLFAEKGERIIALDQKGLYSLGLKIRTMGTFSSGKPSIFLPYIYFEIEGGALLPDFKTETGAFGQYFVSKKTESGAYTLFSFGAKLLIFDAIAGIGFIREFYNKGYYFTHKDKTVRENPDETNHFFAQIGIGITLDIFATGF